MRVWERAQTSLKAQTSMLGGCDVVEVRVARVVDAQIFVMHVKATAAGELTGLCLPGIRPHPDNPKSMKKVSCSAF